VKYKKPRRIQQNWTPHSNNECKNWTKSRKGIIYTSHHFNNRTSTATDIALGAHEPHRTATTFRSTHASTKNWPLIYLASTKQTYETTYRMITLGWCSLYLLVTYYNKVLLIRDLVDGFLELLPVKLNFT
jgi:hypothetical protein